MKKQKVFLIIVVTIVMLTTLVVSFASEAHFPSGGSENSTLTSASGKIWGTIVNIVQIVSFGAILFSGLRYMFAAPDARAEIKKSLGVLALGAIIVFAASSIVKFVTNTANSMLT